MFEDMLKNWPLRLFLKKISWMVIAITGTLIVIIAGLSAYGNAVGDLVITVDDLTFRALALSEVGKFEAEDTSTFLSAEGIKDIRDSSYYFIPEDIMDGNGLKSDTKTNMYFAYSFYLKNMSNVSIGYEAVLKIARKTKGVEEAVRIMIIVDDEEPVIFAKPKKDGTPEYLEGSDSVFKKQYTTVPFTEDEFRIVQNPVMEVELVQKFTIVMWLEGWDVDCNDDIVGGEMEASITFKILENAD